MKKVLFGILAVCFMFTGILFSGCGTSDIILNGGPNYDDVVYGNGGLVVTKGDYLYFASGYVDSDDLGDVFSNAIGSVTNGGLYRAKMVEFTTGEGEDAVTTQTLENVELMVSKVVGFENGGLYIFKDKIYFSSPSTARDSTGVRYDLLTFYSCNLDGSGLTEFYQTTEYEEGSFSITMIDQKIYLLIFTGSKIIKVEENKTATEIATSVTGVAFPNRENILDIEENPVLNESFVYYTKNTESENGIDLGDSLYRQDIVSGEEELLFQEDYISINVISITADRLFYTRNNSRYSTEQSYYSNDFSGEFLTSEKRHTMTNSYTNFVPLGEKNGTNLGVAFIYSGSLYVRGLEQTIGESTELTTSISSILYVSNGYIYYVYSSDIYRIDATSSDPDSEEISDDLTPLTTICDIDAEYCYFYVEDTTVASGHSLYRIALEGLAGGNSDAEKIE